MTFPNQLLPVVQTLTENNNVHQTTNCRCPAIAGMSLALITSLALGLIFRPLAALAGCAGGIVGIILAQQYVHAFPKILPLLLLRLA